MALQTQFDQNTAQTVTSGGGKVTLVNRSGLGVVAHLYMQIDYNALAEEDDHNFIFTIDGGSPVTVRLDRYMQVEGVVGSLTASNNYVLMPTKLVYDKDHANAVRVYIAIPKVVFSASIKIEIENNSGNNSTIDYYKVETIIE